MTQTKRKWDLLTKERKKTFLKELITFFKEERNEEIGLIAAEAFLDFFLENLSEDIYNKGINDAKNLLKKRFADMEIDLDLLINR